MKRKNSFVLKIIKFAEITVIAMSVSAFASQKPAAPEIEKKEIKTEYTLCEYDGRIAVFENRSATPVEVFDVYISSLPYDEQTELKNGIHASDKKELQRLIEDYTS